MGNKWILFMCFGIISLLVASCSYATNETDVLNDTVDTSSINTTSIDSEYENYDASSFEDANSNIDNISIYYGERIDIDWGLEEQGNCTVYIDNKMVNFISDLKYGTINMYNYDYNNYEDFLNSIYPDAGLHNMSIIFEFDTPQKYDVTMKTYKDDSEDYYDYNVLWFHFNINEDSKAKKRYEYNTNLNILKKEKTIHITNISSASYTNPLRYEVIVTNPYNSSYIFISNKTDIVISDTSFGYRERTYSFDGLRHKMKPGVYSLTVVNDYDNTFDTASFTLCNDIIISTSYKIKENDVILNVEIWCEYNTPVEFTMQKLINGAEYEYRTITREILASTNNHKFNFEILFDNVDNNEYLVSISDYWSTIDFFNLTVNYTSVNETGINEDNNDMNETGISEDNNDVNETVNVPNKYNDGNINGNSTNGTGANSDSKENNTDSNSYKSHQSNINDLKEVNRGFGDFIGSKYPISSENTNSYEIIRKSASKSSNNIFSNLGIIILLFIAGIIGYLKFKREY